MKDTHTNRNIAKTETFKQNTEEIDGAFVAISKAQEYLRKKGYVIGSMCGNEPIGFADSENVNYIAKWRNIPKADYDRLSGIMIPLEPDNEIRDSFRDSWVKILFFDNPEVK